ncbi:MAG: hypothetical protein JSU73_09880 [candidate division WOR-3 bacterium]|nr:MAG: hypothetical protein JSU73_09880 [candidate division WOR-3 bacterium]
MLFGTARDALRGLLADGSTRRCWRRLWIPSYFCQDVVASLRSTGIVLVTYTDDPENPLTVGNARFLPGDALLVVNYFGLRGMPSYDRLLPDTVAIIEDHTHDPWSVWAINSEADWCVASLRKTLPVPDGAVLWSPVGHPLFSEPALTVDRRAASLEKLAAMALKALYLEGLLGDKEFFRRLAISGEGRIASGDVSGITEWTRALLRTFPTGTWRERRRENHRVLLSAIGGIPWATVLRPQDAVDVCPFSGIVLFDSAERRDHVRECLMASRVYPTILWPLESLALPGIPPENVDFSRRMLSIHCDMRYSRADMLRVAEMIRLI